MVSDFMDRKRPVTRPRGGALRRHRRELLIVGLLAIASLCALAVVMAVQARAAYQHLDAVEELAQQVRAPVLDGDEGRVRSVAREIEQHTEEARWALAGPHWSVASALPVLGPNVDALRAVTGAADQLAKDTLPQLVRTADLIDPDTLQPRGGKVELDPIRDVQPHLQRAARTIRDARDQLDAVDTSGLVTPLRSRYSDLDSEVETLGSAMDNVAKTARLLPDVLGGEGPRRYLVLVQNNAEPRALGGLTGSVIQLVVDDGKFTLVGQKPGTFFDRPEPRPLRLSRAERALYGTELGSNIRNATATPYFPRTAELASLRWSKLVGKRVDGVAALDPVVLDSLLRATGPMLLPDGTRLTSGRAAGLLLHDAYLTIEGGEQQDRYFAETGSAIFDHFLQAEVELPTALEALTSAAGQGRFLFWSTDRSERRRLGTTPLAGPLAGNRDVPTVGLFVHDRTQAKMGWYQKVDVRTAATSCDLDSGKVTVQVELASAAPADAADLPESVTGGGVVVPPGDIASQIYLYSPIGATITGFDPSSGPKRAQLSRYRGRHVASWPLVLEPGESTTLKYQLEQVRGDLEQLQMKVTPGPTVGQFRGGTVPCG